MTLRLDTYQRFPEDSILKNDESYQKPIEAFNQGLARIDALRTKIIEQYQDAPEEMRESYDETLTDLNNAAINLRATGLSKAVHQIQKDTVPGLQVKINGETFTGKNAILYIPGKLQKIASHNAKNAVVMYTLRYLASTNPVRVLNSAIKQHIERVSNNLQCVVASTGPQTIHFHGNKEGIIVSLSTTHSIQNSRRKEVALLSSSMNIVLNKHGRITHSEITTTPVTPSAPSAPAAHASSASSSSSATPEASPSDSPTGSDDSEGLPRERGFGNSEEFALRKRESLSQK